MLFSSPPILGFVRSWELTAPESYALLHGSRHEHGVEALLTIFDATQDREVKDLNTPGIPVEKLVRDVRKKYGWPGNYADAEVMPVLEARGLYERRNRKIPFAGSR